MSLYTVNNLSLIIFEQKIAQETVEYLFVQMVVYFFMYSLQCLGINLQQLQKSHHIEVSK